MEIFFQSSLPRAGSTLLQNILGQNPSFYVTPTSGLLELFYAARRNYTESPEFTAQDSLKMKNAFRGFCRGGLEGFYNVLTKKPYVMDKSRGWGIHYDLLDFFYPNPKIVCMVRDARDIFSSMEKNFRKSQHKDGNIVNHKDMTGTTTEKRIDIWSSSQPVGLAMERLQEMIKQGIDDKIHFIKYENLINEPKEEMAKLYEYICVKEFHHNFSNVEQITKEDDAVYGIYGDHKIQPVVTNHPSDFKKILGEGASNWIRKNYDWFYKRFDYK
jgi:sulfotransferase